MSSFVRSLVLCCSLLTVLPVQALEVVSSIRPFTLLVETLSAGQVQVTTLVGGGVSPHHFQLKPSHRLALLRADLVLWQGTEQEPFLRQALQGHARALALLSESADLSSSEHEHEHEHEHDESAHDHSWVLPWVVSGYAESVALRLQALGVPGVAERLALLQTALQRLDQQLQQQFAAQPLAPYLLTHNAYSAFEAHYGLKAAGVITGNAELPLSTAELLRLREQVSQRQIRCVLHEPWYPERRLQPLAGLMRLPLDVMGAKVQDPVTLIEAFAQTFLACR